MKIKQLIKQFKSKSINKKHHFWIYEIQEITMDERNRQKKSKIRIAEKNRQIHLDHQRKVGAKIEYGFIPQS